MAGQEIDLLLHVEPGADAGSDAGSDAGVTRSDPAARLTAARRLRPELPGYAALNRLAALAARLLGSTSSQVTLLSDLQVIVGGAGLAPGAVGSETAPAQSLCTVTANRGSALVVEDARRDGRVSSLGPVAAGSVGAYLGIPLIDERGHAVGAMCVFDRQPRPWSERDVTLMWQIASAAVAELELSAVSADEAGRVMSKLAIDSARIGTSDWDLATGTLTWDERSRQIFGFDDDDTDLTVDAFRKRLHPDDLDRVAAALAEAMEQCGEYETEFRVLAGGATRWVTARGRALSDASGKAVRLLGAAYETTAQREGEIKLTRVLESMSTGFMSISCQWRITYVNGEAERLLRMPREGLLGQDFWDAFSSLVGTDVETHYRDAMVSGKSVAFESYYPFPLEVWCEVRISPSADGLTVYFLDVSSRRTAERQVEQAIERSALLAAVTAELAGTLDAEEALARLAQLVVPSLADWCLVTLVDAEHADIRRGLRDVACWHLDPAAQQIAERFCALRLASLTAESADARAIRTRQGVWRSVEDDDGISADLDPGAARDLLELLSPSSVATIPLRGRGRTVGLLTLYNGARRAALGAADRSAVLEIAARAGLALDNARLFAQQSQLAEVLQRSLLTPPPQPERTEIVVRYEPAAEAAQVGGDWYDAFQQPAGTTMLVIGDVVGHDTAAAAAMGQVRGLLRGVAARTGDGPADVLCGVDHVIETLQVGTTASVIVARLEPTPEGGAVLRWSNAGHPPPMVVDAAGAVTVLTNPEPDLLLGIDPASERNEFTVVLDRGATVLLYTDGLVERRGQSLDEGLSRLRQAMAELADRRLDSFCDTVLDRLLPAHPDDDVALVAVRLS